MDLADRSYFVQNIVFTVPLSYIFLATYYGLFNFDLLDMMALHWDGNTDPYSLLYSFYNTWRLAVPAVYNSLQLLAID